MLKIKERKEHYKIFPMPTFCLKKSSDGCRFRILGAVLFATFCYLGPYHSKNCYVFHDILSVYIKYLNHPPKTTTTKTANKTKQQKKGLDVFQFT